MKSAELLPYQDVCEQLLLRAEEAHARIPNSHFSPVYSDRGGAPEGPFWRSGVLIRDSHEFGEGAIISLTLSGEAAPVASERGGYTMTGSKVLRAVVESATVLRTFAGFEKKFDNFRQAGAVQKDPNSGLPQDTRLLIYAGDNETYFIAERTHAIGLSLDLLDNIGAFLHRHNLLDVYLEEFSVALDSVNTAIDYTTQQDQ